jgi:FtsP/CotA-like multicopper oxidase with cupredoxin domain
LTASNLLTMRSQGRLSRRSFLIGTGCAGLSLGAPLRARAQVGSDEFRVLRAQVAGPASQPSSARPTLRYNGVLPGPTLRVKRGEELRVRLVNELAEPTSVHWHGVRLPNAMDGVPQLTQSATAPGASFDYRFKLADAGTFWYHAPAGAQVAQGLYGALIVEEEQPVGVDRDILLVLGTAADGADARAPVLVNGSLRPDVAVTSGERLRLRLVNATASRRLALRLEGHGAWVMAIDGQPAEPFVARDSRVGLGPGNRVDLFVDATREGGTVAPLFAGVADEQPIARLVYERGGDPRNARRSDPVALPPNALPARIDLKGSLKTEMTLASAKPLDVAGAPLFSVRRGRTVTLAVRNSGGRAWAVHVHGHHFRLLDRLDDGWKAYWLDTLVVGEQTERIAFVADNPGKWPDRLPVNGTAEHRRACVVRGHLIVDQGVAVPLS